MPNEEMRVLEAFEAAKDPVKVVRQVVLMLRAVDFKVKEEGLLGDGIPADVLDPHLQERARMLLPLLGVNVSAAVFNKILKDLAQLQGYTNGKQLSTMGELGDFVESVLGERVLVYAGVRIMRPQDLEQIVYKENPTISLIGGGRVQLDQAIYAQGVDALVERAQALAATAAAWQDLPAAQQPITSGNDGLCRCEARGGHYWAFC